MSYKTKAEKRAWRKGLFAGLYRKKNKVRRSSKKVKNKKASSKPKIVKSRSVSSSNNPFGMSYYQLIREEEQRKRDLLGDFE
ncbi:MAG: hypothetical protein IJE25_08975 [Clostridia bacterium]|nr:hypothetical protein [Clostridia bacterium]